MKYMTNKFHNIKMNSLNQVLYLYLKIKHINNSYIKDIIKSQKLF